MVGSEQASKRRGAGAAWPRDEELWAWEAFPYAFPRLGDGFLIQIGAWAEAMSERLQGL